MSSLRWICVASLFCGSCASTQHFHEVEAPSYWWSAQRSVCGHTLVVDGGSVLWAEESCETSPEYLSRQRSLDDAEQRRIEKAFAALPKGGTPPSKQRCTETSHSFRLRTSPEDEVVWTVCVSGGAEWKAKDVPEPYRGVVQLFLDAKQRT
jgi:hypothetical protein